MNQGRSQRREECRNCSEGDGSATQTRWNETHRISSAIRLARKNGDHPGEGSDRRYDASLRCG